MTERSIATKGPINLEKLLKASFYLSDAALISYPVLKAVAAQLKQVKSMSHQNLALFAAIYSSKEMQAFLGSDHMEQLEYNLVRNFEMFDVKLFTIICSFVSQSKSHFDTFLVVAQEQVESWLLRLDLDAFELQYVTAAYLGQSRVGRVKITSEFLAALESCIVKQSFTLQPF
jgi:hypothetical protein